MVKGFGRPAARRVGRLHPNLDDARDPAAHAELLMRWRNGLMGLSVMAIAPVSHEVTNPVILRQDELPCLSRHPSHQEEAQAPLARSMGI